MCARGVSTFVRQRIRQPTHQRHGVQQRSTRRESTARREVIRAEPLAQYRFVDPLAHPAPPGGSAHRAKRIEVLQPRHARSLPPGTCPSRASRSRFHGCRSAASDAANRPARQPHVCGARCRSRPRLHRWYGAGRSQIPTFRPDAPSEAAAVSMITILSRGPVLGQPASRGQARPSRRRPRSSPMNRTSPVRGGAGGVRGGRCAAQPFVLEAPFGQEGRIGAHHGNVAAAPTCSCRHRGPREERSSAAAGESAADTSC